MSMAGSLMIVAFIGGTLIMGAWKKLDCFSLFAQGAKQGLEVSLSLLPTLCAMLVGVSVLQQSGVMDWLCRLLTPLATLIDLPPEVLPLALVRPFSGSAATGVLLHTLMTYGVDTRIGMAACLIMGASETVFYTSSVYFGSVGVQKWRHTLPLCLLGSVGALLIAAILT